MRKNLSLRDYQHYRFSKKERIQIIGQAIGIVGILAYFFYHSFWALFPLSGVGIWFIRKAEKDRDKKQKEELTAQFRECILSVSTALQAGYALENAFLESREDIVNLYGSQSLMYQELEYIRRGLVLNITLEELLFNLAKRSGCEEIDQLAQMIAIAKKTGGNFPQIIKTFANLINERIAAKQEIQIMLSGKKMEQNIMKLMPFAIFLYIESTYPGYFAPLYHDFSGVLLMSVCLLVYLTAFVLIDRIYLQIEQELSGKEGIGKRKFQLDNREKKHSFLEKVCRMAYAAMEKKGSKLISVASVQENLKRLYPQTDPDWLRRQYYVGKMKLCIMTAGIGIFFSAVISVKTDLLHTRRYAPLLLILGVMAVVVAIFFLQDKDLYDEVENQKRRLRLRYPEVVHKIVLFLGAGMSIRGCFLKLSESYDIARYACRELDAGLSEVVVYERFGKRTGLQEYIRLSALLSQSLRKGSNSLLIRLEEEAFLSSRERVQAVKKLGEEAGTKLLVPTVMLLAVVMLMIMVPAFTGLNII